MTDVRACINAIGCAVPAQDMHASFIQWAGRQLDNPRERQLFLRMAERSGIDHRWCVLPPTAEGGSPVDPGGFYSGAMPPTSLRMRCYADHAPALALEAVARLKEKVAVERISHLVVASCTGFVAPGIDQIIAQRLGLQGVERTLVGFMGCYAAVAALRTARHIVRSEPEARVLVVTVELSSLHFQPERQIERLLMMLQFADGAAAALVTAEGSGIAIDRPFSFNLTDSAELIRWEIGDSGFVMHLSGEVPGRIQTALGVPAIRRAMWGSDDPAEIQDWAVHAGGRSILDAVEHGLGLGNDALASSRSVLARFGNMSSSTLMFILGDRLGHARQGVALAFGPGLAAEGFRFEGMG
ncbi:MULTISPECIES: type III polyketide synthase [Sphingobium]|uniref:Stilbene synthase n=1 Tax=Sphingobium chungbukense TaxID=56193 RepID=A0A0M3AKY5_9SPHN|nr:MULTISPECIES: type III polyketide synthase [Sphingobium]KKW90762.1 stilbene synthase [Sphingobium chungbukense]PJG46581.1 type III polyketide synthase [Sphingobium sp. LB126]